MLRGPVTVAWRHLKQRRCSLVGEGVKASHLGVGYPPGTRDNMSVAEIRQEASSLHGTKGLWATRVVESSE